MIYFTSSWDDGAKDDIRLAEVLLKYKQSATFFLPLSNIENRMVINEQEISALAKNFEVGAHTINHKYLTTINNAEAEFEIKECKKKLQLITGKSIHGFCFPGGKFRPIHIKYVNEAGYEYARTVNMFQINSGSRIMNPTLHAFNHSKYSYFVHLIKRGYLVEMIENSIPILSTNRWDDLLSKIINRALKNNKPQDITIIHLWGHSWELQEYGLWKQLDQFFRFINSMSLPSKSNFEIFQLLNNRM